MDEENVCCASSWHSETTSKERAKEYRNRALSGDKYCLTPSCTPLCGELIEYLCKTSDGILALSNYRLYFSDKDVYYSVPLGLIDRVEVIDLINLNITCKHALTYRFSFTSRGLCLDWLKRITEAIKPPRSEEELFAFDYFALASEELRERLWSPFGKEPCQLNEEIFRNELKRMQFDIESGDEWRISLANADYKLCATYPCYLITPASITDKVLESAAKFRTSHRVPVVVWRHSGNGAVIARSSQPEVGWLGWRSSEDEELLKAITDACSRSSSSESNKENKLLIMDARSYTTAVANRVRGGGSEYEEYYTNCEVKFMGLANIHSIRKSFNSLQTLCAMRPEPDGWYSALENTKWLHIMSGLITAAVTVVTVVEEQARPVLVHCSDGWDRTPQITSLAQLLLDPFYRTIEGFQVLVQREWLNFGHKFSDRCGLSEDVNERSPIFLQWLDCIQNIGRQFPCAFEFSNCYLIKLAQHTYSNLFGTFLCNSDAERYKIGIHERTFTVWKFLRSPKFKNHLYNSSQDRVLWPECNVRYLDVWRELYLQQGHNECTLIVTNTSSEENLNYKKCDTDDSVIRTYLTEKDTDKFQNTKGYGREQLIITDNLTGNSYNEKNEITKTGHSKVLFDSEDISNNSGKINCNTEEIIMKKSNSGINFSNWVFVGSFSLSSCNMEDYSEELSDHKSINNVDHSKEKFSGNNLVAHAPDYSSSAFCKLSLDPIDGLAPLKDEVQGRLEQMALANKTKELALERELEMTRLGSQQKVCNQCGYSNSDSLGVASAAPATEDCSQNDEQGSICSTDVSWEVVEEPLPTLRVPDDVNNCMGCHVGFELLECRKNHCRISGNFFCADCSKYVLALPEEQSRYPVCECSFCYGHSFRSINNYEY